MVQQQGQGVEVYGTVFKETETTKDIVMSFKRPNGGYYYPSKLHNFQAKIANDKTLVGVFPINILGRQIVLSSGQLVNLPADDYSMEIWETYTDDDGKEQRTIYPSPGSRVYFTIEENIDSVTGERIKKIGFQTVVNEAAKQASLGIEVDVKTGEAGTQATVTQEYVNGKNYITITVPKGDEGKQGKQGETGESAYELWLHNGHTGTVQDFLASLKGERGSDGKDGKNGTNGKDGKDGKDGNQGPQGEPGPMSELSMLDNGNIAINGKDTGIGGVGERRIRDILNATSSLNLLPGTSSAYKSIQNSDLPTTSAKSNVVSTSDYHTNDWFTYTALITSASTSMRLELTLLSSSKNIIDVFTSDPIPLNVKAYKASVSAQITTGTYFIRARIIADGDVVDGNFKVKCEQLVPAKYAGGWLPNFSEVGGG